MFSFLKSDRTESTMRVNVTLIGVGCFMILLAIAFHIVWFTLKLNDKIYWPQISLALGGIATLMTGVLWQKVEQKKVEEPHKPVVTPPLEDIAKTIVNSGT